MSLAAKAYRWLDVREQVFSVNASLAQLIDAIDPGESLPFYIAEYHYGDVLDDGLFKIRTDQGLLLLAELDQSYQTMVDDLAYAHGSIPASLVLDGCAELYMDTGSKVMTKRIFKRGDVFAFHRKLDGNKQSLHPLNLMFISAGVRSIFMLPNIGDHVAHRNLRRDYAVTLLPPKMIMQHWEVFKQIANHARQGAGWRMQLLLFSRHWLEKLNGDDPAWDALRVYHYKQVWQQDAFWRNKIFYDYNFSLAQHSRNLKPNPYLMDTLKHLLAVMVSALPGFAPAFNDDYAPVSFLKRVYRECYQLKDYMPNIMLPTFFSEGVFSLFYSLNFPTTLVFSPKSTRQASTLQQLRELHDLCESVFNELAKKRFGLSGTLFENILRTHQLNFFHHKEEASSGIKASSTIPHYDAQFLNDADDGRRTFAEASAFCRGCVQILADTSS